MTDNIQDHPIQAGSEDATVDEKIAGIVTQIRADVVTGAAGDDPVGLLSMRLVEAGIKVDEEAFHSLSDQVTSP